MFEQRAWVLKFVDGFVMSRTELHERFAKTYDADHLIIDLRGVDLIDGSFLAELVQLRLHRRNRRLQLGRMVVDSQYVRNALSAVGFDRNWPIYRTLEQAVASFDGPPLYA